MSKSIQCRKPDNAQEALDLLCTLVAEKDAGIEDDPMPEDGGPQPTGREWADELIGALFTENSKRVDPDDARYIDKKAYELVMCCQEVMWHMLKKALSAKGVGL